MRCSRNQQRFGKQLLLPPVGGTAVMSNPKSQSALFNASVQNTLVLFWCFHDDVNDVTALQKWEENNCRVLDLQLNHRSGGDVWYSDMLTSCREGNLTLTDWQFLHGLPTEKCGSWLTRFLLLQSFSALASLGIKVLLRRCAARH